jgi:hypothetical protein
MIPLKNNCSQLSASYWYKDYFDAVYKQMYKNKKSYFDHVFVLNFAELIYRKKNGLAANVIAVAGGRGKEIPIAVCLKMSNFIDVLITDSETAEKMLAVA